MLQRGLALPFVALFLGSTTAADTTAAGGAVMAYRGPVQKLFETHCVGCHNPDALEGGLDLTTHRAALAGGGSGQVIVPGAPGRSRLMKLVAHEERPFMPPDAEALPADDLALLENWIRGGAIESEGDQPTATTDSRLDTVAPISVRVSPISDRSAAELFELVREERAANAITALAANRQVPVVAISDYGAVRLYDTQRLEPIGQLDFPEGAVHVLRFSRDGSVLLAGGGAEGRFGAVVLWDVVRGRRIARISAENDVVLAADITHDHDFVALGGPRKHVDVYDVHSGERRHQLVPHTDWITTLAFSPDGALLACGDRAGAIRLVETLSGLEFAALKGHRAAVTDIDWRGDSNLLASTSEDGSVRLWDVLTGEEVTNWPAHSDGVTAIAFTPDNLSIVTAGRDATAKLWSVAGQLRREFAAVDEAGLTTIAIPHEGTRVLAGALSGRVHVWQTDDGSSLGSIEPPSRQTTIVPPGDEPEVAHNPFRLWWTIAGGLCCLIPMLLAALWLNHSRRSASAAMPITSTGATTDDLHEREAPRQRPRRVVC